MRNTNYQCDICGTASFSGQGYQSEVMLFVARRRYSAKGEAVYVPRPYSFRDVCPDCYRSIGLQVAEIVAGKKKSTPSQQPEETPAQIS